MEATLWKETSTIMWGGSQICLTLHAVHILQDDVESPSISEYNYFQVWLYQPGQTSQPFVSWGRGMDQEDSTGREDGSQWDPWP